MVRIIRPIPETRGPDAFGCTVIGPESDRLTSSDLVALLSSETLSGARASRFHDCAKIAVQCGPDLVGVAAYRLRDGLLRVEEFAVENPCRCDSADIISMLLHALEAACLAGGGRRVVLGPDATGNVAPAEPSDYTMTGPSAGLCLEKTLL